MLASVPASMVNQKPTDLGIPNRFSLTPSRFREVKRGCLFGDARACPPVHGAVCLPAAYPNLDLIGMFCAKYLN